MWAPLKNPIYRRLLLAQVIALLGTGLATVALGLLAYDLAGDDAGAVLGTALAIKMVAFILVAPVVGAFAGRLPRRAFLVSMDGIRAGVALMLPFVDQVWQVYLLVFVLQSASAAFTPTFQATIPEILPDEADYTAALSLSRLAYDLESLVSPLLAALLLTVIGFHWLFSGTAVGFLVSALLILPLALLRPAPDAVGGNTWSRITLGARVYLRTPRLRGLLAITLSAAAASAMVIVNTVVLVRAIPGFGQTEVAVTLAAHGGGSMAMAFALPRLLGRRGDRPVMLGAAAVLTIGLGAFAIVASRLGGTQGFWLPMLAGWALLGAAYGACVTPGGRLLRRSAAPDGLPALFAAQFALSHVCWLVAYPLAGQAGAGLGQPMAFALLAGLALTGVLLAWRLWPANDPDVIAHRHPDLPPDHDHILREHGGPAAHGHPYRIDALHSRWPDAP